MASHAYLDSLLDFCHQHNVTDLHLCAGSVPLARVNSRLHAVPGADVVVPALTDEIARTILEESKYEALQQQRSLDFSFSKAGTGRFRCNVYSQRGTYAIAIRALAFDIPPLSALGLPMVIESFTQRTKGLFLATGPTSSGKSTTLASLLDIINERYQYHIITIEDPIEYIHKHKRSLVTQREIGEDAQSFSSALRAALREDPDVILVGEMRDPETISIALTAAETGHLVLSTLHTIGAAKAVDRIIDAFPQGQQGQIKTQLAAVLEGVISQHLIPRADGAGIIAASEVMVVNPAIRNLIREGKHYQINSILQTGQNLGMQPMEMDIARLIKQGLIAPDEGLVRAGDVGLLTQYMNRA